MCLFLKGGQVDPVPPSLNLQHPCVVVPPLRSWWVAVMGRCIQGNEVSREVCWLGEPWNAYLKRLSPAPSSHWSVCTLILCAGTLDPRMQRWVARTKVIAILLLTYPHVLE